MIKAIENVNWVISLRLAIVVRRLCGMKQASYIVPLLLLRCAPLLLLIFTLMATASHHHNCHHCHYHVATLLVLLSCCCYFARTHARLEPTMPLTCHVWCTRHYITREPKFPQLRIATQSQLGEQRDNISKHPNHSWRNDYDWGYTENTLTALYTTLISLYWSEVLTFHGTITGGKVTE